MVHRDYYKEHPNENPSYCHVYANEDLSYMLVLCDAVRPNLIMPDGYEFLEDLDEAGAAKAMEDFARAVNPCYDSYTGHDDQYIALDVMHPVGCSFCPFFSFMCDEMNDESPM